jgi:hypothetical protein
MSGDFHLVDLVSQASAVRKLLVGKTDSEKLTWLASQGKLEILPRRLPDAKQTYLFESVIGREAGFFLDDGDLVFLGDHTPLPCMMKSPLDTQTPNKSAPGKGGITSLFHARRACPALPERYR